jgi:hypothetical protein
MRNLTMNETNHVSGGLMSADIAMGAAGGWATTVVGAAVGGPLGAVVGFVLGVAITVGIASSGSSFGADPDYCGSEGGCGGW